MRTLIIYDDNGTIFFQGSGNINAPIGLQHMYVDLKSGSYVVRVDVTNPESHVAVTFTNPISEIDKLWDIATYLINN